MPTVVFESHDAKKSTRVEAPNGGQLADLIDDNDAPIPFSCRSASCATCHIEVLEGETILAEPEDEELDVLDAIMSKPPRFRLACQAKCKPGPGTVRVRAQNEY
jgi:2Fe-2S ferredoxin